MRKYHVTVTGKKGVDICPGMFGLFFEDINYAADGGLYAEMIENRSFECVKWNSDAKQVQPRYDYAWGLLPYGSPQAGFCVETEQPLNEVNPHYLKFSVYRDKCGTGLTNRSYDGLSLKKGANYRFSVYARADQYDGALLISIEKDGRIYAAGSIAHVSDEWKQYELCLQSLETVSGARLVIRLERAGTVCFDVVSLFPEDTFRGRKNGLRKDLAQLLADIHPGFIRFPGGCIIEGFNLENRYHWKDTVGDVASRRHNYNRWQAHMADRFDHYCQTYGLGYFEYFQFCEDIGARPVPVVNCGMGCQYQTADVVALDSAEFDQYIQDALDLAEFANGDPTTKWGAVRAEMGHPEPFHMDMIGIGNEQWDTPENQFFKRYEAFQKAFAEKYPEIRLVATAGPAPDGKQYDHAWEYFSNKAKELKEREAIDAFAAVVDEHFYKEPDWFFANTDRYDSYDRESFHVFAGEYAAHDREQNCHNNLRSALAEAAMLTGYERNADIVRMAAYAPLFAREGYAQWKPDLIWFNADQVCATPNYYVQKMYGNHTGSYTLVSAAEGPERDDKFYQTASFDNESGDIIIKMVNAEPEEAVVTVALEGADRNILPTADAEILQGNDLDDCNSMQDPEKIRSERFMISGVSEKFDYRMPKYSFVVLRIHTEG